MKTKKTQVTTQIVPNKMEETSHVSSTEQEESIKATEIPKEIEAGVESKKKRMLKMCCRVSHSHYLQKLLLGSKIKWVR